MSVASTWVAVVTGPNDNRRGHHVGGPIDDHGSLINDLGLLIDDLRLLVDYLRLLINHLRLLIHDLGRVIRPTDRHSTVHAWGHHATNIQRHIAMRKARLAGC